MSLRNYIIGMLTATVLCWLSWLLVLFYIDPTTANIIGFLAFYLSLFFALIGSLSLVGLYLRIWLSHKEVLFAFVGPSFRQGVFLSLILIGNLLLQSFGVLKWWDAGLLIAGVSLLELYFRGR